MHLRKNSSNQRDSDWLMAYWRYEHFRCRIVASPEGITVSFKSGAEKAGHPGEIMKFFRATQSREEAETIALTLPEFGPKQAKEYGFDLTDLIMLD